MARLTRHVLTVVLWAAAGAGVASAQPVADAAAATVYTRARVVSVLQEPGRGGKLYVRLKLLPRSKIPFTTQAFRVLDPALVADIPEGAWVKFTTRRVEGENTLASIQVVEECKRFQTCD